MHCICILVNEYERICRCNHFPANAYTARIAKLKNNIQKRMQAIKHCIENRVTHTAQFNVIDCCKFKLDFICCLIEIYLSTQSKRRRKKTTN